MKIKLWLLYKSTNLIYAILLFVIFSQISCVTTLTDISPNKANGTSNGGLSTAGLIINIAGDKNALYAVSPNAGIWKNSVNASGAFSNWVQLASSPRYANCIAVDPFNNQHIVVGERTGDANNNADNNCGVRESFNGGKTFPTQYYFDPSVNAPAGSAKYQLIQSVVFTNQGTILIATVYGVARKTKTAITYDFLNSPINDRITALATFDEYIMARNETTIYISTNDGVSWTPHPIPKTIDGLTVSSTLTRGDLYSIAGLKVNDINKFFVYISFKPTEDIGNKNTILIFDVNSNLWHSQILNIGDGTGLGGRRFIKSYDLSASFLIKRVGDGHQLLYGAAQEVLQAIGVDINGIPEWREFAQGPAAGPYSTPAADIHSDIWDLHFDPNAAYAFVAGDGGVFETIPFIEFSSWVSLNSGLHTHHIHSVVTGSSRSSNLVAYATSDNDAWAVTHANNWFTIGGMGDANWETNDQGNGNLLISGRHFQNGVLSNFPSPSTNITINNDLAFYITQIKCIQTLKTEPAQSSLDAVMLVNLPLKYVQAGVSKNVPGILGMPNANGNPVLIRNKKFELNADINLSKGTGWEILFNDLPRGTKAFWVAEGHNLPACYLYADGDGIPKIYKRDRNTNLWVPLNITNIDPPAEYGPLFVNPYDANILYIATANGIFTSVNAGSTFTKDDELTSLVTASGRYSIDGTFYGANGNFMAGGSTTHANPMCPLSCMAFDRDNPKSIVASSPFTGIFYKNGNLTWKNLSKYLPKPFTPISSLSIAKSAIYIGTEGRGIFKIDNY